MHKNSTQVYILNFIWRNLHRIKIFPKNNANFINEVRLLTSKISLSHFINIIFEFENLMNNHIC